MPLSKGKTVIFGSAFYCYKALVQKGKGGRRDFFFKRKNILPGRGRDEESGRALRAFLLPSIPPPSLLFPPSFSSSFSLPPPFSSLPPSSCLHPPFLPLFFLLFSESLSHLSSPSVSDSSSLLPLFLPVFPSLPEVGCLANDRIVWTFTWSLYSRLIV